MKRWTIVGFSLLAACTASPTPTAIPGASSSMALAAAIPEGRTPEERRQVFRAAVSLFDDGKVAASEPLFLAAAGSSGELADYALRYLARVAEARADRPAAHERWGALASRYPESVWLAEAAFALGAAAKEAGDLPTAVHWLEIAVETKDPVLHARALWLRAEVAELSGDRTGFRTITKELRSRHPGSAEAGAARERAWDEREEWSLQTATAAVEEITLLLSEGQGQRALELARLAEPRFAGAPELPEITRLEATALGKTGDPEASVRLLEEIRRRYPRHPAAARALYRLAVIAWNRDDDPTALDLFREYGSAYPRGSEAAEALYASARIHQEARQYAAAAGEYERLARLFPQSSLAPEARWRVGWCEYRAGHGERAARIFGGIGSGNASERAAALYWRARSLGEGGAAAYEELLREFPESYYATLAEARLGRPEGSSLSAPAPAPSGAPTCGLADPHRTRFEELRAIGLPSFARLELAAFEARAEGCDEFLMRSWQDAGGFRQAVAHALRSGGCGLSSTWVGVCYPRAFWDVVREKTGKRSLDPYVVLALIRQESLFDPEARSSADAIGLMQILPSTGSRLAAEVGIEGFRRDLLVDPERNVELGTAYLRKLLDRFEGNLPRALAAYNAGENAVDKWQRRYPDLEDDEFVEAISYRETRAYVKRVLQNRRLYRALYQQATAGSGASPAGPTPAT